jgi:hypothetical protein
MLARMAKARAARAARREVGSNPKNIPDKITVSVLADTWKKGLLEIVGIGIFLIATGLFIYGGSVLARDCKVWLKTGNWEPTRTHELWRHFFDQLPHTEWVGVAKIFDWVLSFPLSGFLIIISLVAYISVLIIVAKVS